MRSADLLVQRILNDPELLTAVQANPQRLRDVADQVTSGPIYHTDVWVYRGVVLFLGIVVTTVAVGLVLHAFEPARNVGNVSDAVVALGSAALGALAGLLAPSPTSGDSTK